MQNCSNISIYFFSSKPGTIMGDAGSLPWASMSYIVFVVVHLYLWVLPKAHMCSRVKHLAYIYIYACVCVCVCDRTWGKEPSAALGRFMQSAKMFEKLITGENLIYFSFMNYHPFPTLWWVSTVMRSLICQGEVFTFNYCELFKAVIHCVQRKCGHATSTVAMAMGTVT